MSLLLIHLNVEQKSKCIVLDKYLLIKAEQRVKKRIVRNEMKAARFNWLMWAIKILCSIYQCVGLINV